MSDKEDKPIRPEGLYSFDHQEDCDYCNRTNLPGVTFKFDCNFGKAWICLCIFCLCKAQAELYVNAIWKAQ